MPPGVRLSGWFFSGCGKGLPKISMWVNLQVFDFRVWCSRVCSASTGRGIFAYHAGLFCEDYPKPYTLQRADSQEMLHS